MIKSLESILSLLDVRTTFTWHLRTVAAVLLAGALSGWPSPAKALQPLDEFVRGARTHDPANREAEANRDGAEARADEALGRALPGLTAAGLYTRNQWEVSFGGLKVVPRDQLDASATLGVPLVDLAKFARIAAARRLSEAAAHRQAEVVRASTAEVVQRYYQLAANLALRDVARSALEVVQLNLRLTEDASRAGTVTGLDVQRSNVEVERQRQQLESADLDVKLIARALASQTGVVADVASAAPLTDDLHHEPALEHFIATVTSTPTVRAAASERAAADKSATAQRLALVPALNASATERYTNATGFLDGHHAAYAATVSLTWGLDFTTAPAIRARDADAAAAAARDQRARLTAGDAIFRAWSTIETDLVRSHSTRSQAAVSARAADVARSRYRSGVGTQLEAIQADRDAFAAEAGRIQSDADLLNARAQLRLVSGEVSSRDD